MHRLAKSPGRVMMGFCWVRRLLLCEEASARCGKECCVWGLLLGDWSMDRLLKGLEE